MTAISNNVQSRPVKFKLKSEVATIVNLVVELDMGAVKSLTWSNSCNDNQGCSFNDCKSTSLEYDGKNFSEKVRETTLTEHVCRIVLKKAAQLKIPPVIRKYLSRGREQISMDGTVPVIISELLAYQNMALDHTWKQLGT